MNVAPRRPLFNRRPQSNIYRMFLWIMMMLGGVWMLQQVSKGEIKPLFEPTPTPTRAVDSYLMEGDAQLTAGKLNAAISAYQEALRQNPNDAETWAKLARIQTYSSAFLITNPEKKARLLEALESADKAVGLAPENSMARAIRAFTLDWNASSNLNTSTEVQDYLIQAEQEALQALQFDTNNTLALAYYAEILIDQLKWTQAETYINQALESEDAGLYMDVYRVHAYFLETGGQYNLAIAAYEKAVAIEPNFTFLYLRIGANYRRLASEIPNPDAAKPVYEKSLEYFERAARINEVLEVKDPVPYLSISRTYSQLGEFFAAAINVQKALEFEPDNADIYGQLGIVFFRSRNYEGSIYSLKCAIRGCSGEESCQGRGLEKCSALIDQYPADVTGLALEPNTIVYYYTYGSVLAALSRPRENRCPEAMQVMGEVRTELETNPDDYADGRDTILSIVEAGEEICSSLSDGDVTSLEITPEATATGEAMLEPALTPTP